MSAEELKKYIPDTPEELSYIGGSINRLGAAITTIAAFEEQYLTAIISAGLIWLGNELSGYFKIWLKKQNADIDK